MTGRCSIFGGIHDDFMKQDEGLALWEHWECDRRPDLFNVRSLDTSLGSSKRLKDNALYFAYRYDATRPRACLQKEAFLFTNPKNKLSVVCHLVDWGPSDETMRMFDLSPYAASLLRIKTDEEVTGEPY